MTSESPKAVARAAYAVAQGALPAHSHKFSLKRFTQPQLFVCPVLKVLHKTDYRGIVAILEDSSDLCKAFDLSTVPDFTTLQKASRRLLRLRVANELLYNSVKTFGRSKKVALAAVDSTGLEARHISRYFVRRRRSKQLEIYETTRYRRRRSIGIPSSTFLRMPVMTANPIIALRASGTTSAARFLPSMAVRPPNRFEASIADSCSRGLTAAHTANAGRSKPFSA